MTTDFVQGLSSRLRLSLTREQGELAPLEGGEIAFRSSRISETDPGKSSVDVAFQPLKDGERISIETDLFLNPDTNPDEIHLLDFEGDAGIGTAPGLRVVLKDGRLAIDPGKIGVGALWRSSEAGEIETGVWRKLRWDVVQGDEQSGRTQLYVDGVLALDVSAETRLTQQKVDPFGLTLDGGELSRVQFGVTATMDPAPVELQVRNVSLTIDGRRFDVEGEGVARSLAADGKAVPLGPPERLVLQGGSDADVLRGSDVATEIRGRDGDDDLRGGGDDDVIYGGSGADTISGGPGFDNLFGGPGADVFVFGSDGAYDVVNDFVVGVDRLDISGLSGAALASLTLRAEEGAVILKHQEGGMVLVGVEQDQLGESDFIF